MDSNARNVPSLSNMPESSSFNLGGNPTETVSGLTQPFDNAPATGELAPALRGSEGNGGQKDAIGQDALGRLAHGTAERLQRAAATVRDRGQRMAQGAISQKMTESTANVIDQAATFVDATSAKSIKESVLTQMRQHPWVSLGLGLTVGVWLGRALKR